MLTSRQIVELLTAREIAATEATIEPLLANIDQNIIWAQIKSRYTFVVWDKVSPINGVEASIIISNLTTSGEVYLVYFDGQLVLIQPHDPLQVGFVEMSTSQVTITAEQHLNLLAQERAKEEVMNQIIQRLQA